MIDEEELAAGATSDSGIEVVDTNNDIAVDADDVSVCEADEEQKTGRFMRGSKASHNQVVVLVLHCHIFLTCKYRF